MAEPTPLEAFKSPSVFANRMHIIAGNTSVRIVFGEETSPGNVTPQVAITLTISDAMGLGNQLAEMTKFYQQQAAARIVVPPPGTPHGKS